MKFKHIALTVALIAVTGLVSAHGGGLNKDGCHNEKLGK